jgi:hypothetical protein
MMISPDLLAAYADDELDAETARRVEMAIADSPQLQADLAAHHALRKRLAAHFSPIAEQPIPELLRQAVMGDEEASNVIDLAAQARKRHAPLMPARWARVVGPALAATLVLALIGFGLRPSNSNYAQGDLAQALNDQLVATQKTDSPVRVLLSFQDKQGHYCRGFTGQARSGIACRDDRGWRLIKILDGTQGGYTEYRQAGNPDMAVMAAIQDMAEGEALDAAQEDRALRQGWSPRSR